MQEQLENLNKYITKMGLNFTPESVKEKKYYF